MTKFLSLFLPINISLSICISVYICVAYVAPFPLANVFPLPKPKTPFLVHTLTSVTFLEIESTSPRYCSFAQIRVTV